MSASFVIKYDGLDATNHTIDMRKFGEAIVGLDKVINNGLIAISEYRIPKKGERFPLRIHAQEPKKGSFEVAGEIANDIAPVGATVLPLVHEMFYSSASDIVWRWVSWVLNMSGGREKEADPHFVALLELTKEIHRGRTDDSDANRKFLLDVLDRVAAPAKGIVAPVGTSADTVTVAPSRGRMAEEKTTIDEAMADAIRSKERLVVGDMETFTVSVDGFSHDSRTLKIANPDAPEKFMTASVRDPAFTDGDNVYTRAAANRSQLIVSAKPSRSKDGTLRKLYILDAEEA
ncbi:MAG: hypothetical protein ACPGGK_11835 [Pikeienuella sp.]